VRNLRDRLEQNVGWSLLAFFWIPKQTTCDIDSSSFKYQSAWTM